MMGRWLLMATLLGGCAAPAMPQPRMALDRPVASLTDRGVRFAVSTDRMPRSGPWRFTWKLGEETITRDLDLTFRPDGGIEHPLMAVETDADAAQWGEGVAEFGGSCGPQLPDGRTGFGCDRYRLKVVSPREMVGTVALRVNYRWLEVPVTGRWQPVQKLP